MVQQFALICFCCWMFAFAVCGRIDGDYFIGSVLRSSQKNDSEKDQIDKEQCKKDIPRHICQMGCYDNHICLKGKCWCVDRHSLTLLNDVNATPVRTKIDSVGLIDLTREDLQDDSEESERSLPRPALRHHIAHFCPNLDDARTCISKCMSEGRPAFCGKDHECYCGHKYTGHSTNKEHNAKEMYAEFRDMYEKYFGKGYKD